MSDQPNVYQAMFHSLCDHLRGLKEKRSELEVTLSELNNEIAHLEEVTDHLLPLAGDYQGTGIVQGLGITAAIRAVLSETPVAPFSPTDLYKKLQEKGFDFSGHTQPMASIYKILTRLRDSGEVESEKNGHNISYIWKVQDEDIPF